MHFKQIPTVHYSGPAFCAKTRTDCWLFSRAGPSNGRYGPENNQVFPAGERDPFFREKCGDLPPQCQDGGFEGYPQGGIVPSRAITSVDGPRQACITPGSDDLPGCHGFWQGDHPPIFLYRATFSTAIRFADENHRPVPAEKPGSGRENKNRLLIFPYRFSIAGAIPIV